MISEERAKAFCRDDISLIENYDKAAADKTQTWHCHHRRETVMSRKDLIEIGEYYNRPAIELIFLTKSEHNRLHKSGENHPMFGKHHSAEARKKMSEAHKGKNHSDETRQKLSEANKGKHLSEETRQKMSEAHKGKPSGMKDKHHSEEYRKKMSESIKGENNPMFGKHHSAEARKKMSEANNGKNNWIKGTQWFNNGVKSIRAKTCPEGFVKGRIKL